MKEFLKKIKLIDHLTTELQISRKEFVNRLNTITDMGNVGMFSNPFEVFSSSKNEFIGQISFDRFELRKRRKIFDRNTSLAIAKGALNEHNGGLMIETEINGFNNYMIFFSIFLMLIYSIIFIGIMISDMEGRYFVIPFIIAHGILMFLIPYFMMRRSVKTLKYELEREFYYVTKNDLQLK